jgi:hypothetical protein
MCLAEDEWQIAAFPGALRTTICLLIARARNQAGHTSRLM